MSRHPRRHKKKTSILDRLEYIYSEHQFALYLTMSIMLTLLTAPCLIGAYLMMSKHASDLTGREMGVVRRYWWLTIVLECMFILGIIFSLLFPRYYKTRLASWIRWYLILMLLAAILFPVVQFSLEQTSLWDIYHVIQQKKRSMPVLDRLLIQYALLFNMLIVCLSLFMVMIILIFGSTQYSMSYYSITVTASILGAIFSLLTGTH